MNLLPWNCLEDFPGRDFDFAAALTVIILEFHPLTGTVLQPLRPTLKTTSLLMELVKSLRSSL